MNSYQIKCPNSSFDKTIKANGSDEAIAEFFSDLSRGMVPSETVVFHKRDKVIYGPQQIIDIVAKNLKVPSWDVGNCCS
jgi:hypothetical protein